MEPKTCCACDVKQNEVCTRCECHLKTCTECPCGLEVIEWTDILKDAKLMKDGKVVDEVGKPQDLLLTKRHYHPLDYLVIFCDDPHWYFLRKKGTNIFVRHEHAKSVSGLVGQYHAKFDRNVGLAATRRNPNSKYKGMSDEMVFDIWDNSSVLGTKVHDAIEHDWNGKKLPKPIAKDKTKVWNEVRPELQQYQDWYDEWWCKQGWVMVRTEWIVHTTDLETYINPYLLTGTIDALAYDPKDGQYIILDWKRCTGLENKDGYGRYMWDILSHRPDTKYWHYSYNLGLYERFLRVYYGINVKRRILVGVHPDQSNYKIIELPDVQEDVKRMLQLRKTHVASLLKKPTSGKLDSFFKSTTTKRKADTHDLSPFQAIPGAKFKSSSTSSSSSLHKRAHIIPKCCMPSSMESMFKSH